MSDKGPGQEHFKANYIEVIKRIVPDYYEETEYNLFGSEEDLQYRVLGSILYTANNVSSLISYPKTYAPSEYSAFSGATAYVPYFVPFNNLTNVSPTTFETYVLRPLGRTFNSFTNREAFADFLSTSALPHTELNNISDHFAQQFSAVVDPNVVGTSAVSNELVDKLGWVYLQNTSGMIVDSNSVGVSSFLYSSILDTVYYGKRFQTSEGVRNLFKWMYYNGKGGDSAWDSVRSKFLPVPFSDPSSTYVKPAGQPVNYYASGGQLVSALDTLVSVWVNEDDPNTHYFRDIVNAALLGLDVTRMENAGPMSKMLKALAYGFYDVQNSIRDIQYLLDIEQCPDEFLQYLGRYLGWTFFSDDPDKWRDQLKQAIYLYKAKGTRQALANAVNMVIPSSVYNPNAETSGLQELWESYLPNLIYYTLKTETELGVRNEEYLSFKSNWNEALAASSLPMRVKHFDPNDKDVNVRFAVDAVLELLNQSYNFLQIGGIPYQETDFWKAQEARYGSERAGYRYRDALLRIPPWEEQRFYQNCRLGPNLDDFVISLSSILSRKYEQGGCGVAVSAAGNVSRYILSAVEIKDENGVNEPGFGANNTFKFMTSSLELPYNYKNVINKGDLESMSVFDYWNSKSSEVHTKLHASAIDFSANDFTNLAKTKIGRKGIPTIVNIFRQFAPFHTLNKIYVGSGIVDDYWGTRYGPIGDANYNIPWSGTQNIEVINTIQSDMDQLHSTYNASAFPGAWGAYGTFSGVGVFPSIYNPQNGRWLPSATLHNNAGTGPQGYFWSGGGSVAADNSTSGFKQLTARRTAGRRRDLKYKFTGWAQNRQGLNQPIATDWFGMSGPDLRTIYKNRGLNIPGFVPKGFNFSSQQFVDTSGSLSSVYSYYNSSGTPFFEFEASSFFPQRNIPGFETNASSFTQLRDVFGSQILRAMTDIFIRRGRKDARWYRFTDQGFENFKFGTGIQKLYHKYNSEFRRQLQCWVDQETQVDGDRYAGGFNIIAHVFGPLLFNHNFSIKGNLQNSLGSQAFPRTLGGVISSTHSDWSAVVATKAVTQNNIYLNASGGRVDLSEGILTPGAFGTYSNYLDVFENPGENLLSNRTMLSGIEFVAGNVNSIAVWNNRNNPSYNIDLTAPSGVTFLQRHITDNPIRTVRARFALPGNANYSWNGDLRYPPRDSAREIPATSSVAGWALQDKDRTPDINRDGHQAIPVGFENYFVNEVGGSALPYIVFQGRGGTSGTGIQGAMSGVLGTRQTANFVTVSDPTDKQTPNNLRSLVPNNTYQLTLEASCIGVFANNRLTYAVFNDTKGKHWVEGASTWSATTTTLSSNYVNVMTSGGPEVSPGFRIFSGNFTPDSTFEQGDVYQLMISPASRSKTVRNAYQIRNIKVKDYETPSKVRGGRQGNKLFKDQYYHLGIDARVAKIAGATASNPDEKLYVRIVTDPKPYVGNGWHTFAKNWYYDWKSKSWKVTKGASTDAQWQVLDFAGSSTDDVRHVLEFNTLNNRTPLKYFSLSKDGPMNGYFASAGPVHDDQTVYYVEIGKPLRTGEFNGITLLGVDIVNKHYNVYAEDYNKKDFGDIFDFFDDLNVSKSSRDARDSSGTYLLSGGSRSEYLEYWGGSHSATNGVYGFLEND